MYYDSQVYEGDPDQNNDYNEPEEKEDEDDYYDEEEEQIDSGSKTKSKLFSQMSREGKAMDTKNIFEQMMMKEIENNNKN